MASTVAQRIRVGVIGLSTQGWASWGLIPPMLQLKDSPYEIAAICTSKPKSSEQQEVLRSKYGRDLKIYSSPQEMAQAPDLDLIVVSVRAPDHEKSVMPALDSGLSKKKDIFIEWPACGNLKSCELMAKKASQLGIRVMIGLQGRQSPVLKKLRDIVRAENGEKGIGTIVSSTVIGFGPTEALFWGPRVTETGLYVTDRKNSATMLHIMVGHLLDPFLRIFGDVASLTATQTVAFPTAFVCDSNGVETGATVPVSSPDQLSFSLLTKSNALCSFHYRAGLPMIEGRTNFLWLIDGTEGTIRLEGDGRAGSFLNIVDPTLLVNGKPVEVTADPLGKVGRAWAEFARDGSETNYATAEDAVRIHRVIEAILTSAEKNTPVVMN